MARSAKPRKRMTARTVEIPRLFNVLSIRDEEPMLALEIYASIETFISAPTIDSGNNLCRVLCQVAAGLNIICRGAGLFHMRDPHSVAVVSAIRALEDVSQRHRQHGDVAVRPTEALTLRAAAGKLDEALGKIPVHVWHAGCQDVKVVSTKLTLAQRRARLEAAREVEAALAAA